jgi:glycosyltransferase involved in cell wall biosynthesis
MMKKRDKISVIMLTYNREQLVGRAVESILNQTFRNFEFLIVDNGSTDRSGEICDEYAAKDPRIRVIHRARGNIGSGRNAGLDAAKGEFIAFIDDDDFAEKDLLEFLYRLASENDAEIAICGASDKIFDEKRVMTAEEALVELLWRKKYNVAFPAKLFKASLFDGIRFSETSKYDDIELMPRIIGSARRVAYHGLPKYTFVRHAGNNSAWTTNHKLLDAATLDEYLSVYRTRTEWLVANFPGSAAAWLYFEWSFLLSMTEKITRLGLQGCERQRVAMTLELQKHCQEFLNCSYILDFEREWMRKYVRQL